MGDLSGKFLIVFNEESDCLDEDHEHKNIPIEEVENIPNEETEPIDEEIKLPIFYHQQKKVLTDTFRTLKIKTGNSDTYITSLLNTIDFYLRRNVEHVILTKND